MRHRPAALEAIAAIKRSVPQRSLAIPTEASLRTARSGRESGARRRRRPSVRPLARLSVRCHDGARQAHPPR
jgi:hypothetical protein